MGLVSLWNDQGIYLFCVVQFFEGAKCICGKLTASGYWADFVDPSCGRAVSKHLQLDCSGI